MHRGLRVRAWHHWRSRPHDTQQAGEDRRAILAGSVSIHLPVSLLFPSSQPDPPLCPSPAALEPI